VVVEATALPLRRFSLKVMGRTGIRKVDVRADGMSEERPSQRDPKTGQRRWVGVAPEGTRPRDLRSSFITLQIYAGVPLTTIARWCGTSVEMLDRHYAGVIANWDGVRVDPEEQIREAREALRPTGGRSVDVGAGASGGR
jgi:hypothetical protein